MEIEDLKKDVKEALRQYGQTGLRWSYLIIGVLVILGAGANLLLPKGWVVWPAVLAIGIMVMLNEAADRNNQGIPPLHVYGWFIVALTVWIAMAVLFSALFPILVIVGIPSMVVYNIYAYLKNKKRDQLIADRRAKGQCIHCGQAVEISVGCCEHCGKDLVPEDTSLLKRFQVATRTAEDVERTRDILTPKPATIAAKRKEQALLARRPRKTGAPNQTAPKQ